MTQTNFYSKLYQKIFIHKLGFLKDHTATVEIL